MALMRDTAGTRVPVSTKGNVMPSGAYTDQGFDLMYAPPDDPKFMGSFTPLAAAQGYYTSGAIDELRGATDAAQGTLADFYRQSMGYMGDARGALTGAQGDALASLGQSGAMYDPYAQAGQQALGQLGGGLSGMIAGARGRAQPLIDERTKATTSALSAAGLDRSGYGVDQIADISEQTVMDLAAQDLAARQGLAGMGLQGAAGQAGALSQMAQAQLGTGQGLAGLYGTQAGMAGDMGSQLAGTQLGLGSNVAGLYGTMGQNLIDLYMGRMQKNAAEKAQQAAQTGSYLNAGMSAGSNLLAGLGLSDERLKKNIKPLFSKGGVNFYSFEANEEGKKAGMTMTEGVLAQELEEIYPDLVHDMNGFKAVDYAGLLERVA